MNRRGFSRALVTAAAGITAFPLHAMALFRFPPSRLTIATGFPVIDPLFENGWKLGIDEAARSAQPLGVSISPVTARLDSGPSVSEIVSNLTASHVSAFVSCSDDETTRLIAEACADRGIVHLNCGSRANTLRRSFCKRSTYHVEASEAMYTGARRLLPAAKTIELWNAKLERYGAAQLNDRFTAFSGKQMNGPAWAGWFAVKVVLESHLRGAGNVAAWIGSDAAQFDGHKGAPLSFRRWDGQLRQPLYALADRLVDVPDISRSDRPAREILDTIGDGKEMSACPGGVIT